MLLYHLFACQMVKTIILPSKRTVSIQGTGSPVVFSTGLMNIIPPRFYSALSKKLQENNFTVLTTHNWKPMYIEDIEEIADAICVDKVGFVSHSLFDPYIMESRRITCAVCCDPINIPFYRKRFSPEFQMRFIKANKLYRGDIYFPSFLDPAVDRTIDTILYENMGHTDILDDIFASFSKWTGFWDTANPIPKSFHEWKYKDKDRFSVEVKIDRSVYRTFIAQSLYNISYLAESGGRPKESS